MMLRVAERIPALHDIDPLDELSFHLVSEVSTEGVAGSYCRSVERTFDREVLLQIQDPRKRDKRDYKPPFESLQLQ